MAEVLKVLVAKETLDQLRAEIKELRAFKEAHHAKTSENLTKEGSGGECPDPDNLSCNDSDAKNNCNCQPSDQDCSYNEDLNKILEKDPPVVETEKKDEQKIETSLILSRLWPRFHKKATSLLQELEKSSSFQVDKLSMVYIDGNPLDLSIFQVLRDTFHPNKKVNISKYSPYIQLLKKLGLTKFVSNKFILVEDKLSKNNVLPDNWYFIN